MITSKPPVNVPETPLTVIFPKLLLSVTGSTIGGVTAAALLWGR